MAASKASTAVSSYLCANDILNDCHSRSRGCPILEGQRSRAFPQQHPEACFSGSSCSRQVVATLQQNRQGCYGLQHGCHVAKALFSYFAPTHIPISCLLEDLHSVHGDLRSFSSASSGMSYVTALLLRAGQKCRCIAGAYSKGSTSKIAKHGRCRTSEQTDCKQSQVQISSRWCSCREQQGLSLIHI